MEIVTGPDSKLWFTSRLGLIGRITTGGQLTQFPLAEDALYPIPLSITVGPDGNLWYTVTPCWHVKYGWNHPSAAGVY